MKLSLAILFAFYSISLANAQSPVAIIYADYTEAKAVAQTKNIPILMVFAGSDWCKPCIQFKNSILSNESFLNYAEQHLVILYLDFPLKKKNQLPDAMKAQNESLAEKYNETGVFPKIIMIDFKGNILGEIKFQNQSPETFMSVCNSLSL